MEVGDKERMEQALQYIMHLSGIKYFYGGEDPIEGFDCSGLACEYLKAGGKLPNSVRVSAQNLYLRFSMKGNDIDEPKRGALVFYGSSTNDIGHVAICLDKYSMLEAGGGSRSTDTDEEAADRDAFVRVRPINRRKDIVAYVDPFK